MVLGAMKTLGALVAFGNNEALGAFEVLGVPETLKRWRFESLKPLESLGFFEL